MPIPSTNIDFSELRYYIYGDNRSNVELSQASIEASADTNIPLTLGTTPYDVSELIGWPHNDKLMSTDDSDIYLYNITDSSYNLIYSNKRVASATYDKIWLYDTTSTTISNLYEYSYDPINKAVGSLIRTIEYTPDISIDSNTQFSFGYKAINTLLRATSTNILSVNIAGSTIVETPIITVPSGYVFYYTNFIYDVHTDSYWIVLKNTSTGVYTICNISSTGTLLSESIGFTGSLRPLSLIVYDKIIYYTDAVNVRRYSDGVSIGNVIGLGVLYTTRHNDIIVS